MGKCCKSLAAKCTAHYLLCFSPVKRICLVSWFYAVTVGYIILYTKKMAVYMKSYYSRYFSFPWIVSQAMNSLPLLAVHHRIGKPKTLHFTRIDKRIMGLPSFWGRRPDLGMDLLAGWCWRVVTDSGLWCPWSVNLSSCVCSEVC